MKLRPGLLLAVALFTIVCMSACTRDYTCECIISYSGKPGLPDTLTREYPIKDTKKKAESLCQGNSNESEKDGIKTIEHCDLY